MYGWNVSARLGLILFLGMTLSSEISHSAGKLTLHGKILKPDNTPVNSSSVSFQIQIRSPGVENCLLYQETQTLNLSSNPGVFNLSIGSGTRPAASVDGGFTLDQIFQNRSLIDLSAAAGACTNPATSYTPAADDQRNISIQFNDGSGWQSVTAQKINPVPRALDSGKVGGYDSAQLLRVADGVPTAQTELSGAQWTELLAVISGTSTVYSKPNQLNGVNLPVLSNGQTMVWNAGAWTAVTPQALPGGGTNGQVLTSDGAGGATWTDTGANASSLTSGTLNDARLSSNVALKNASNTFSIGNQNITNGAPTEVNLILKGAAAQSANMLEVRNSANTLLYSVETSGTPVANTDLANKAYVDSTTSTVGANYVRKDGTSALTGNWAVGNFDITGIKNIGAAGYFNQAGMAAPAVSAAGEGRIYFDSVAGKFKVSQSGGAYADLVGGGGGLSGLTAGRVPYATGASSVADSSGFRWDDAIHQLGVSGGTILMDSAGHNVQFGPIGSSGNTFFPITIGDSGTVTLQGYSAAFGIPVNDTNFRTNISAGHAGWSAMKITSRRTCTTSNNCGDVKIEAGGNVDQLFLANSGYVGIGTALPNTPLEVAGNFSLSQGADRTISVGTTTSNIDGNALTIAGGTAQQSGGSARNGGALYLTGGAGYGTTGANSGGNVFVFGGTGTGTVPLDANVIIAHNGTSAVGKVGIGTNSPAQALDVVGNGAFTGALSVGGDITIAQGANRSIAVATTTTNVPGNNLTLSAGTAQQSGGSPQDGGSVFITGGNGYGLGGYNKGGNIYVYGGSGTGGGGVVGDTVLGHNGTASVGNVGIGTAAPTVSLDVNGGVRAGSSTVVTSCGMGQANGEGTIRYNYTSHSMEYCNGTSWQPLVATQGATPPTAPAGVGYFVVTNTTWNGNLGGLSGADSKCLTELSTTYTNWAGYADANTRGILDAAHVKAFLCTTATCNNLLPSTTYAFAAANAPAAGGATFTTDGSGAGPSDNVSWAAANRFSGSYTYWTNRNTSSSSVWSTAGSSLWNDSCDFTGGGSVPWTQIATSDGYTGLSTNADEKRWKNAKQNCAASASLICIVNP